MFFFFFFFGLDALQEQELLEIQDMIREERDSDALEVVELEGKGKGVLAGQLFCKGEYICEYAGELISKTEADEREQKYLEEAQQQGLDEMMCYMYFLKHNNHTWW